MSFDNRQFNVNGEMDDFELFRAALALAVKQEDAKIIGYVLDQKRGMILAQYESESTAFTINKFPFGNDVKAVADYIWIWLKSMPPAEMKGWDRNIDQDGHNEVGWRIYCEDWGYVGEWHQGFIAIKPAYLWYGK